jgi:hypothetical protein
MTIFQIVGTDAQSMPIKLPKQGQKQISSSTNAQQSPTETYTALETE